MAELGLKTFAEIEAFARVCEPTQPLGSLNVMAQVAELAAACRRLEYNTAQALHCLDPDEEWTADYWLEELRKEIP